MKALKLGVLIAMTAGAMCLLPGTATAGILCWLHPDHDAQGGLNLWVSYHFAGADSYDNGDYREAARLLETALPETENRVRRAETLDKLGRVYTALGQFDQAESSYQEALSLKEHALGKRHRDVACTLNNIADLHYILDKKDGIEDLYRRALEINKRDQWNIEVARSLNGLALVQHDANNNVEAEKLLTRAVTVNEKGMRRDHPYEATALVNLGILYTNEKRYDEAEKMFLRASYIQTRMLRPDHPDVAVRLHATAVLLQATNRAPEAIKLAAEAETIRSKQTAKGDLY